MKISPVGVMVILFGLVFGIIIWIVAYFGLPNADTHRNISQNPPVATSVNNNVQLSGTTGTTGSTGANQAPFYSLDKVAKTLDLNLVSGQSTDNSGLNFNGYSAGKLIITVPVGWKVNVTYANKDSQMPHSIGFTTWAHRNDPTANFPAAFPNSIGPKFNSGLTAADQPVKFSFTAATAGQYAFVCGIPGHAAGGMWDEFDVSASAKAPTINTGNGAAITVSQ